MEGRKEMIILYPPVGLALETVIQDIICCYILVIGIPTTLKALRYTNYTTSKQYLSRRK